jgi:hypothetical protein
MRGGNFGGTTVVVYRYNLIFAVASLGVSSDGRYLATALSQSNKSQQVWHQLAKVRMFSR